MGVGLEVYRPDGQLIFSATDRLGRILGSIWTNSQAVGNLSVPEWGDPSMRPWIACVAFSNVFGPPYGVQPSVWVVGATLHWQYAINGNPSNTYLIFGVY